MHEYVMGTLGEYVKKTYCCPENFTMNDLHEIKEWGKSMQALLEADKLYNVIEAMEKGDNSDVEMTMDEFIARAKDMYSKASATDKATIKTQLTSMLT